jgi:hypothetical protein
MHLETEFLWRSALALIAVALLWAAVGFGAYALHALLAPEMGVPAAAALTAAIALLVLTVGVWINHRLTLPPAQAEPTPAVNGDATGATGAALAQLAKDHPLLAVGCAAILGVAESVQADNRRSRGN